MLSVKEIYDGNKIKLLYKAPGAKKYKVIVTFIEEINGNHDQEIRDFSSRTNSFAFWEDEREDLYQDYLKK
jgi:hypothetical protein